MRALFYQSSAHWSGSSRAFSAAARGLAARGDPVTIACRENSGAHEGFLAAGLDVVGLPAGESIGGDAWRLRAVLKERFVEAVFLHTEREQLAVGSAMRLAERGAIIRRMRVGSAAALTRSGKLAQYMATTRLLFSTEEDRARSGAGDQAFLAPLGVDVSRLENARDASREALRISPDTQLIVCAIDKRAGTRLTTPLRTLALLAERHPELRLVLVGRDADADDTRMHAAALGVTSLVRFLGERPDVSQVCAAADVGWVAAEGDDGAFACLDFMSARVPIIADRSPVVSHFVPDGIAGVLLPPADPSDTAATVARFLVDADTRIAMGKAGHTRARRDFGEAAMIDGFADAANAASDRTLWAAR